MDTLQKIVDNVNTYMSDYILIFLLVGIGLFYSIRTKFVQVRCFGEGMKEVFGKISLRGGKQHGGMSSFQALATAIAAQVGTGNVVGACGAILVGGPGAIFWMWIIAFFGMATIYAEATLAQKTRVVQEDGTVLGGPVYYIRQAFKSTFGKILSVIFSVCLILALGFMGAMVQSNSIASTMNTAINSFTSNEINVAWIVGLVIAAICAIIFIGGAQRVASVAEKIVPVMAVLYILGGLAVICIRIQYIPETFGMIFKYAFAPNAIIGGGIGFALKQAISQGAKRGLFSNEAGMGSTPHAHAMAKVETPHKQGVVAMMGVFIDTFVVLNITALVVISTLYAGNGPLANGSTDGFVNSNMAQKAFGMAFGNEGVGNIFVAICLLFFAFTTIIGWNLFAKINVTYLFGKHGKTAGLIFSVLAIIFIFLGSVLKNDLVWSLTDMFNNFMVIPNVIALAALSGIVVGCVKEGVANKKAAKAKKNENK
ncbi:MAG: sodium:alanine symporter family protein [Ruminococcaceae bacterium]|nr:sodium:alanine symporter family protein [Oscillospiraceae bacterium]